MSGLQLDDEGDLLVENGDLVLTTPGFESIKLNLRQNLRFFSSEWVFDERIGLPFIGEIITKNPDPVIVDSVFKRAILNTAGVVELTFIEYDLSPERALTINFKALTNEGEIVESIAV